MYCAIIADIIKSREIKERLETQRKLNKTLEEVNNSYKNEIASKFTITIGDEFQGLLSTPKNIMRIIGYIKYEMYPIKLRFGIGFGEMNTDINSELAIGSDGPAYHVARKAIDDVKLSSTKYEQPIQDIIIYHDLAIKEYIFDLLNATLSTCAFIENRWSEKHREVINKLNKEDISQRKLAEKLGLKQSSIQRRLDISGYFTYKYAQNNINETIMKIWEITDDK